MCRLAWSTWVRCVGILALTAVMACGATNDFNPATGDWNNGSNWSLGHAPLISEDVTVTAGKTVSATITANQLSLAARSLTIASGGAVQLSSGTTTDFVELTIATNLTVYGQMIVGGGVNGCGAQLTFTDVAPQMSGSGIVTFGNSTASAGANAILLQANATLAIGGTLSVAGTSWTIDQATPADGTVLPALVTIANTVSVTIASGSLHLNNGINLTNNGTLALGVGASLTYDANGYSDLTQGASGSLAWAVNGSGLSAVFLPYSVHLAGTLNVIRASTYFPSNGDAFSLLNLVQSNIIGNFTTFTGTADFTNDFVLSSRAYAFSFRLDLQTITWSQIFSLQAVNGANLNLSALSDATNSVSYVTYTVALASGGAASSTIIPSSGPGVRAQLHPGAVGESVIITAHAARTANYDDAMAVSSTTIRIAYPVNVAITTPSSGFTYGDVLAATTTPATTVTWSTTNAAVVAITNGGATATVIGIGSASVTATGAATSSNVVGSATLALGTINPKVITVTVVNQARYVGDANPANSFTVSGLVNNDTAAILGTPTYAGSGTLVNSSTAPGNYPLTVSFAANAKYSITLGAAASLTISPLPLAQRITFASLADLTLSTPTRALGASASSGLAITYTSSNTAVATVNNTTGQVTAVAVGSVIITAAQAGDATYAAATSVAQPMLVTNPQPQTISFQVNSGAALSLVIGNGLDFTGSSTSGLALTYTSSDPTVASVSGSHLTALAFGSVTITATQAGNVNFFAATPVISSTLTVIPLAQTITWSQIIGIQPVNGANLDLTALSNANSSFAYVTYTVALVGGGAAASTIVASTGPGVRAQLHPGAANESIVITAHAAATGNYGTALPVSLPAITIASPAVVAITTPAGGFTYGDVLMAMATPTTAITWSTTDATVVSITSSGTTATIVGMAGGSPSSASVTATAAVTSLNTAGSATLALGSIQRKAVTVTVTNQARYVGGTNPANAFTVSGLVNGDTAAALGTPTFSGSGTTADATTAIGSYPLSVSFSANANYVIAFGAAASLTISAVPLLPQTITFPAQVFLPLQQPTRALGATASSGLAITYVSSNTAVATVNNTTGSVTAVAVGSVDITASQAGDATHAVATPVTQALLVTRPVAQTITFQINGGGATAVVIGDGLTLAGSTTSALTLIYTSSDPTVATIIGTRLTAVAVGTFYVIASQAGNANFLPAVPVNSSPLTVIAAPAANPTDLTLVSAGGGGCGAGGGVALIMGALVLGWRRRTITC